MRTVFTFETKAQPIAFPRRSLARVWFDIKDNVEVRVEVYFTKLLQLRMLEVFESTSLPIMLVRRRESKEYTHNKTPPDLRPMLWAVRKCLLVKSHTA